MFDFSTQKNIKEDPKTPEDLCTEAIRGFKEKSDHNKRESMLCFWFSMGGSLAAPIFVTLGEDIAKLLGGSGSSFILSKLIPTLLSAAVAFSTAWLQLRKPQQLWALYRTSQRHLEDNLNKYRFKVAEYSKHEYPDQLLVERITQIALDAHYSWLPMVPNPEDDKSIAPKKLASNDAKL